MNKDSKEPLVSIIIVDYKKKNPYLVECLDAIGRQTYKHFEIILVTDFKNNLSYPKLVKKSYGHYVGPAQKRDVGAKMAKGKILAFIDDDAHPSPDWLKNIIPHFSNKKISAVGGPGVTPLGVSWLEEASGWASASPAGAGIYTYRFLPSKKRFVEDYPSMNLSVRKTDFEQIGGYDSNFWPGEDTKLCHDLVHKINKKIIYDPKVLVYHHRRPILGPHLRQAGNFGLHRGYFVKILPQTSLKIIYFGPSLMVLGLLYLFLFYPFFAPANVLLHCLGLIVVKIYLFVLVLNSFWVYKYSKKLLQAVVSVPVIFITHLWYGIRFLQGIFFTNKLTS